LKSVLLHIGLQEEGEEEFGSRGPTPRIKESRSIGRAFAGRHKAIDVRGDRPTGELNQESRSVRRVDRHQVIGSSVKAFVKEGGESTRQRRRWSIANSESTTELIQEIDRRGELVDKSNQGTDR
jgi:hypothetical protein